MTPPHTIASGENPARFNSGMVALHWLTAAMVAALWLIAQAIDVFPRDGTMRATTRSLHIALGLSLIVVLLCRIALRRWCRHRLPLAEPGMLGRIATWMHYTLYALLLVLAVSGPLFAWIRGDSVFGIFTFASPAPDARWLRGLAGEVHEFAANGILVLAGLHGLAALFHHFVMHDDTLRRMLPGR
jgi:cytochrome b561